MLFSSRSSSVATSLSRMTIIVVWTIMMGMCSMLCLITPTDAVLYGDEQYGDIEGGKFWAFYSQGIALIDPMTCTIEHTINNDNEGNVLPTSWNDGVYMQSSDNTEGYMMIGSRVDETNALGDIISHAYVISTTTLEVISKVEVG
jgi:DNA-binding beta-propeller fold protein YncE